MSLVEEGYAAAFVGNAGDKTNYGRIILQVQFESSFFANMILKINGLNL